MGLPHCTLEPGAQVYRVTGCDVEAHANGYQGDGGSSWVLITETDGDSFDRVTLTSSTNSFEAAAFRVVLRNRGFMACWLSPWQVFSFSSAVIAYRLDASAAHSGPRASAGKGIRRAHPEIIDDGVNRPKLHFRGVFLRWRGHYGEGPGSPQRTRRDPPAPIIDRGPAPIREKIRPRPSRRRTSPNREK